MNETLQALLAQNPGLILQALQSQPTSPETGETAGPVEGYALYDPTKTAYGQAFQRYSPDGAFLGAGQFKKPGNALQMTGQFAKDMAPLALAAVGANALGSALGQPSMFSSGLLGSSTAPGLTGADAAMADLAASGGLTPASMGGAAGAAAVGGAAGGGAAGLGSLAGGMSGKVIGGLLGAAAGAANSGDKTQTTQQRLDPRMEAMLYGADGKGGYLGAATDWFNQNKGGNPLMLQGAQMMADFYRSPQYTEGYNSLRSTGLGLLNTPMAGNPFTQGGAQLPAMGGGMPSVAGPQMPQNKIDLSGAPGMEASPSFGGGMMDMRYRGGPQMTPEQRRQREADMLTMMNQARGFGG